MNCPHCGLHNVPNALRCECGHDFVTGMLRPAAPFHSGHSAARAAVVVLALALLVDVAAVVSGGVQASLVGKIAAGQTFPTEQLQASDRRQQLVGIAQILALLAGAVAFLRWLRVAYGNLPALGVVPRFSRSWAVAVFLVPILHLFRPYQVVRELWVGSGGGAAAIVGWWWAAYLGASFLGARAFTLVATAKAPRDFLMATWITLAGDVCGTAAAALAIAIVLGIDRGQARAVGPRGAAPGRA
jgi:Domain of unknown function (DUF4328)